MCVLLRPSNSHFFALTRETQPKNHFSSYLISKAFCCGRPHFFGSVHRNLHVFSFDCCWARGVFYVHTERTGDNSSTSELLIQNTSCLCTHRSAHTTWTYFVSMPGCWITLSLAASRVSIVPVLPIIIWCFHPINTFPLSLPLDTGTIVPLGLPYHSQIWLRFRVAH